MEIGAVIGASPKENVIRETPLPDDVIVLLGGRTGRDGCGGATGSSKAHDESSIETCGAEVQKGNPPTERKIQRLFRNPEVAKLIKRCNDFGAGGVCVAIGELADGLTVDLDKVTKKYDGLDGTELAISESQERMAVVLDKKDVDKFISLASKEASGTGNMKFMLNGAVTLGTEDGANVEIHDFVGDDNIYIFGDLSETVVERYANGSYCAAQYYNNNPVIKEAVDFITGSELMSIGDKERLERLSNELIGKDWFMTFPDFDAYVKTREQAYADYENRHDWAMKMLVNIAKAGYFSSDRTIEEYNRDIWKLEQ